MIRAGLSKGVARFALAVLVPLFLLAGIEACLRLFSCGFDPAWTVPGASDGVWRDNPDAGRLWFPPSQVRSPVPFRIAVDTNRIRVVVLGESAAMGDPVPDFGLAPQLESMLRVRFPDAGIDVVNAAMTAIDSSVIVGIARDIARLRPDVVVVYMGNNEVVGPFGPSPGHRFLPSLDARYARAVLMARSTRIGQWLWRLWHAGVADAPSWRGLAQFTDRAVAPDSDVLAAIHERYRDNLAMIIRHIAAAGAVPVVSTVASRPYWPPFGSDDLPGGVEAASLHDKALVLQQAGRREEALAASCRSRDIDPLRFRADAAINDIIRSMADRAVVVDLEAVFMAAPEQPQELFWDHVHFTPEGNFLAAQTLAAAVEARLSRRELAARGEWPDRDAVLHDLVYTPWDELNTASAMYHRLVRAPFTGMKGHREMVEQATARFRALRMTVSRRDVEKARDALAAATAHPDLAAGTGARLLRAHEELEEYGLAMNVALRLVEAWPHVRSFRHALGRQLIRAGNVSGGLRELELGEVPSGSAPDRMARIEAAAGLADIGRVQEAMDLLGQVLATDEGHAKAWYNRAVIHGRLGQLEQARADFLRALAIEPDMAEAFNNLGVIDLKLGRMDDAERHFRQALDKHPYHVGALRNLVLVRSAAGDQDGVRRLRETLAVCDPDWTGEVAGE